MYVPSKHDKPCLILRQTTQNQNLFSLITQFRFENESVETANFSLHCLFAVLKVMEINITEHFYYHLYNNHTQTKSEYIK